MPSFEMITSRAGWVVACSLAAAAVVLAVPVGLEATEKPVVREFHSFAPSGEASIWRSEMDLATQAWEQRRFDAARVHLEEALEKGNFRAAWYLAHLYELGRGVERNRMKALAYYRTVAKRFFEVNKFGLSGKDQRIFADALVRVADAYRDGVPKADFPQNSRRAFHLYNTAGTYNHPGADHGRGIMYLKGIGVEKNPNRARGWFGEAARKRYAPSLAMLGDLYWSGLGVEQNKVHALAWYLIATKTANPAVHSHIFQRQDQLLANFGAEDEAVARGLAERWQDNNPVTNSILPVAD